MDKELKKGMVIRCAYQVVVSPSVLPNAKGSSYNQNVFLILAVKFMAHKGAQVSAMTCTFNMAVFVVRMIMSVSLRVNIVCSRKVRQTPI